MVGGRETLILLADASLLIDLDQVQGLHVLTKLEFLIDRFVSGCKF